jgi:hypothetical protein
MASGIGPKKTLEAFDIPVISDLPGVGQNLTVSLTTFFLVFSMLIN